MIDLLKLLAGTVVFIAIVGSIVWWDERRRVRWEQAKDRLKGYHYDA